jgi:FkbM family methyltransferase
MTPALDARRVIGFGRRMLKRLIGDTHSRRCYSQEGEDMILARIFEFQREGFYVDVGAHHPKRFSNTYYFYKLGWQGINIEPNPDAVGLFRRQRARDINLNVGISSMPGQLEYYRFQEPAFNTFDEGTARARAKAGIPLLDQLSVRVEPLASLLDKYVPVGTSVDFLSIDVEGKDFEVLLSNDWRRFRPRCVVVEELSTSIQDVLQGRIHHLLDKAGYELFSKTVNSLFYLARQAGATTA